MDYRDICKWLSAKESMRTIANLISDKIDRKLQASEIRDLQGHIKRVANQYVGQVSHPRDDPRGFRNIQKDVAKRYRKIITKREGIPSSEINTHEMLKAEIVDSNKDIHEASGFAELKHQDEYCFDADGIPAKTKFGGRSGKDIGIFGEQPVVMTGGAGRARVVSTVAAAKSSGMIPYRKADDDDDEADDDDDEDDEAEPTIMPQRPSGMTEEQWEQFQEKFTQTIRETSERQIQTDVGHWEEEKARDDSIYDVLQDQKIATDEIKYSLQKIMGMAEYFYKVKKTSDELPPEQRKDEIWFRDSYLQFDTRFRDLTFTQIDNEGQWRWAVSNIPFIAIGDGVGVTFALEDIVEMEIEEFEIPLDNLFPNYYGRVTLFIEELNTQSVMSSENTRYHWDFKTSVNGNRMVLTPMRRKFTFKDPIRFLTQTTLTFRWPYQLVPFNLERITAVATPGSNPVLWTTTLPHNINTNDPIYFTDVDTGNPVINSLVNSTNGHQITKISSTSFTIPIDFTTVGAATSGVPIFGQKRIIIPIRFRCLSRGIPTNYMKGVGEHVV